MPTTYPGREDQHDLGDGHSFTWLSDQNGDLVGLVERHNPGEGSPEGGQYCGGYVAWTTVTTATGATAFTASHELITGGPGDEAHLTISPSIQCQHCTSHGFIRDGRWADA